MHDVFLSNFGFYHDWISQFCFIFSLINNTKWFVTAIERISPLAMQLWKVMIWKAKLPNIFPIVIDPQSLWHKNIFLITLFMELS